MGLWNIWVWKSFQDELETAITQTQKCVPSYFENVPTKSELLVHTQVNGRGELQKQVFLTSHLRWPLVSQVTCLLLLLSEGLRSTLLSPGSGVATESGVAWRGSGSRAQMTAGLHTFWHSCACFQHFHCCTGSWEPVVLRKLLWVRLLVLSGQRSVSDQRARDCYVSHNCPCC